MQFTYIIYNDSGEEIDIIRASEEHVQKFCARHNYTYEQIDRPVYQEPEPVEQEIPLSAQVQALSERQDFIEDVLAEFMITVLGNE